VNDFLMRCAQYAWGLIITHTITVILLR